MWFTKWMTPFVPIISDSGIWRELTCIVLFAWGEKETQKRLKMRVCTTQSKRRISGLVVFWGELILLSTGNTMLNVMAAFAPLTKITLMLLPWRDLRRFVTPVSKPAPMKIPLLKWYRRMVLRALVSAKKQMMKQYTLTTLMFNV